MKKRIIKPQAQSGSLNQWSTVNQRYYRHEYGFRRQSIAHWLAMYASSWANMSSQTQSGSTR